MDLLVISYVQRADYKNSQGIISTMLGHFIPHSEKCVLSPLTVNSPANNFPLQIINSLVSNSQGREYGVLPQVLNAVLTCWDHVPWFTFPIAWEQNVL